MPRCTSTNKFASMDEVEAEVQDESIDGSTYSATVRAVRLCGDCSEEMMEYTFELEAELACDECGEECGGHYGEERDLPDKALPSDKLPETHEDYDFAPITFEIASSEAEVEDYMQTTDRRGKPITNYRYQKHMFKCVLNGTATCACCGAEIEFEASDETGANGFESLVD